MKIYQILERYRYMDKLIRSGETGSAREFASRIGISRSQLFNYFDDLRSLDIDIRYDPELRSYSYENDLVLEFRNPIRILYPEEMEQRNGGSILLPEVQGYWTGRSLALYRECS